MHGSITRRSTCFLWEKEQSHMPHFLIFLAFTCSWWFPWCSVGRRRLFARLPHAQQCVSAQGVQKWCSGPYKWMTLCNFTACLNSHEWASSGKHPTDKLWMCNIFSALNKASPWAKEDCCPFPPCSDSSQAIIPLHCCNEHFKDQEKQAFAWDMTKSRSTVLH